MTQTYQVCVADTAHDLAEDVNKFLAIGWKLQGGVSTRVVMRAGDSEGSHYAQALTFEIG